MPDQIHTKILSHVKSHDYRPQRPRGLARELELAGDETYPSFRNALRELMREGRIVLGSSGTVMVPGQTTARDEFIRNLSIPTNAASGT